MGGESECETRIKKQKTMKRKYLFLAIAALLAAGGLWFLAFHKPSTGAGSKTPRAQALAPSIILNDSRRVSGPDAGLENSKLSNPKPGQMLRPPVPNRRFTDFTPEQRVQFARQGHGPGG
jgi:hypothetical protein